MSKKARHKDAPRSCGTSEELKFDAGKLPMHLIPPEAEVAMANRLRIGAKKYAPRGWETGIEYSRCYSALRRHLLAWWAGEDIDPDPPAEGSSHLEGVLINAAFLVTFEKRQRRDLDDRPRKNKHRRSTMSLLKSARDYAVSKNIKHEMAAGKPQRQAVAIAMATKRKAMHDKGDESPMPGMSMAEHEKMKKRMGR